MSTAKLTCIDCRVPRRFAYISRCKSCHATHRERLAAERKADRLARRASDHREIAERRTHERNRRERHKRAVAEASASSDAPHRAETPRALILGLLATRPCSWDDLLLLTEESMRRAHQFYLENREDALGRLMGELCEEGLVRRFERAGERVYELRPRSRAA